MAALKHCSAVSLDVEVNTYVQGEFGGIRHSSRVLAVGVGVGETPRREAGC